MRQFKVFRFASGSGEFRRETSPPLPHGHSNVNLLTAQRMFAFTVGVYDMILFLPICKPHQKVLLACGDKNRGYFMPHYPLKMDWPWKEQIAHHLYALLKSINYSEMLVSGKANTDCASGPRMVRRDLLAFNQIRLTSGNGIDWLHQLVVIVEFDVCACGSSSNPAANNPSINTTTAGGNGKWFRIDQLANSSELLGPEPFLFCISKNTAANTTATATTTTTTTANNDQSENNRQNRRNVVARCHELSIASELKNSARKFEQRWKLMTSLDYGERDIGALFCAYVRYSYPSFFMNFATFSAFVQHTGLNLSIRSSVHSNERLFRSFCCNIDGDRGAACLRHMIQFKDLANCVVSLERNCPHGESSGEFRARCIFRYYSISSNNNNNSSINNNRRTNETTATTAPTSGQSILELTELTQIFTDICAVTGDGSGNGGGGAQTKRPANAEIAAPKQMAEMLLAKYGIGDAKEHGGSSGGRYLPCDEFVKLVGRLQIRGTASLYRATQSPLKQIRAIIAHRNNRNNHNNSNNQNAKSPISPSVSSTTSSSFSRSASAATVSTLLSAWQLRRFYTNVAQLLQDGGCAFLSPVPAGKSMIAKIVAQRDRRRLNQRCRECAPRRFTISIHSIFRRISRQANSIATTLLSANYYFVESTGGKLNSAAIIRARSLENLAIFGHNFPNQQQQQQQQQLQQQQQPPIPNPVYGELRRILRKFSCNLFGFPVPIMPASQNNNHNSDSTSRGLRWDRRQDRISLESKIMAICSDVCEMVRRSARVVKCASPIYVFGDIHGNFRDLMIYDQHLWSSHSIEHTPATLFLGDYVDRGEHSVECALYLFCMKLCLRERMQLLRGNHELRPIQMQFTFRRECVEKFGAECGDRLWNAFNAVFDCLPLAAVIDEQIFGAHGGIPTSCFRIEAMLDIPVPLPNPLAGSKLAWQAMWNDPISREEYRQIMLTKAAQQKASQWSQAFPQLPFGCVDNVKRSTGHYFSEDAVDSFLELNGYCAIIRAHEMVLPGFAFTMDGKVLTLFSCSNYCGSPNESAILFFAGNDDNSNENNFGEGSKIRIIKIETNEKFQ